LSQTQITKVGDMICVSDFYDLCPRLSPWESFGESRKVSVMEFGLNSFFVSSVMCQLTFLFLQKPIQIRKNKGGGCAHFKLGLAYSFFLWSVFFLFVIFHFQGRSAGPPKYATGRFWRFFACRL